MKTLWTTIVNVLCFGVGTLLVGSGLLHMWNPFFFARSMAAYRLLPEQVIPFLAFFLPALEIVLGGCMVFGIWLRSVFGLSAALFASFGWLQLIALALGRRISCGCFGFFSREIGWDTALIPISCAVICFIRFVQLSVQNSLQQRTAELIKKGES